MSQFIKQCKGKYIGKLPKSTNTRGAYLVSTKYDGNYVQIQKIRDIVTFYTSGGKPFQLVPKDIEELLAIEEDFILEAEYIATTDGRLGSRGKCTTTTFRTNYSKGIISELPLGAKFMVFDIIDTTIDKAFRTVKLRHLLHKANNTFIRVPHTIMSLEDALAHSDRLRDDGWEGVMATSIFDSYKEGKRVNTKIKIKSRPTADLLCIDATRGEGKYSGKIGALVLRDTNGLEVSVGSGLDDKDRSQKPDYFIGKIVEIEYEQILDTYIQPVYVGIRYDKSKED